MIGNAIYEQVEKIVGSTAAPKITGMIIDLDDMELIPAVSTLENLTMKAKDANTLLERMKQQIEMTQKQNSQPVVSGVIPGANLGSQ